MIRFLTLYRDHLRGLSTAWRVVMLERYLRAILRESTDTYTTVLCVAALAQDRDDEQQLRDEFMNQKPERGSVEPP